MFRTEQVPNYVANAVEENDYCVRTVVVALPLMIGNAALLRTAVAKAGFAALTAIKFKGRSRSTPRRSTHHPKPPEEREMVWPSEASQPSSPSRQRMLIARHRIRQETDKEDIKRYFDYVEGRLFFVQMQ